MRIVLISYEAEHAEEIQIYDINYKLFSDFLPNVWLHYHQNVLGKRH